jgi:hypothetical protein
MMMLKNPLFGRSKMDGYQNLMARLIEIGLHNYIIDLFTKNQDSFGQMEKLLHPGLFGGA